MLKLHFPAVNMLVIILVLKIVAALIHVWLLEKASRR